jgi:hypothetical protein
VASPGVLWVLWVVLQGGTARRYINRIIWGGIGTMLEVKIGPYGGLTYNMGNYCNGGPKYFK